MSERRPECALCGRPTGDLCAGCGLPMGRAHGAQACPRCARRSPLRARWVPDLVPTGRCLGLILLFLLTASFVIVISYLFWPA